MKKLCFIVLLLVMQSPAYAADLFIQSVKARILAEPSFGASMVAEAQKGERLSELEKKGNWFKVSYRDKTGWVSRLIVSPNPPAGKISIFEDSGETLESGARRRASAFTTAAAARGLAEERARISDKYRVDYQGLKAMEALKISEEEALAFLQAGVGTDH